MAGAFPPGLDGRFKRIVPAWGFKVTSETVWIIRTTHERYPRNDACRSPQRLGGDRSSPGVVMSWEFNIRFKFPIKEYR